MDRRTEKHLLETALEAARNLGIRAEIDRHLEGHQQVDADAVVRIGEGRQARSYLVEIKQGLRPATLGAALHQIERFGKPGMLIADYVTPPMAETLKTRGIPFLDATGNAFIDQPPLFVWVKGQRPQDKLAAGAPTGRAFRPGGLKVLFALLCHPDWVDHPYRNIADQAGVAHGTVGWVMTDLQQLGFVADIDGKRRLLQQERLLKQWTEAYARTLRPKLVIARYRTDRTDWWPDLNTRKYEVLLGGESAAEKVTGHLRPETVTLYAPKVPPRLLLDYKLRADPAGPVEVVKRFWAFDTEGGAVVPLPLIYADLVMTGDARCLETADLIYERILHGFVG
jgi:hypothetical protein